MTFPFPFFVSGPRFPVIVDSFVGNEIGANVTTNVTMPAVVNAGDLLIVCLACWNSTTATSYSTPAGWSVVVQAVGSGQMRRLAVFYKVADGTEDGATVNFVTNNNAFNAWVVYRITNYTGTPEGNTIVTSTSSAPNSDSLTPSWGVRDTLWITVAGTYSAVAAAQTVPSGYLGLLQDFAAAAGEDRPRCATAHVFRRAASEDPGAFGVSGDAWGAYTIAVRGLG